MIERWSRDQVLELAPDASSRKAAQGVASPAKWSEAGVAPGVVWGACKGSGANPYRACVDLSEPAYKCGCPSRKFPCKHALGLLLLWSADGVPAAETQPQWVAEWLAQRRARAAPATTGRAARPATTGRAARPGDDPAAADDDKSGTAEQSGAAERAGAEAARRAAQRDQRVTAGLAELERWLTDQIRQGLAGTRQAGFGHWDDLARRLVDAQAPGVAGVVSRLAPILAEEEWPGRILEEYAMLHLLAVGHRRGVPGALGETVRSRIGFPVTREEVLAGEAVRDDWYVLGRRDQEQDRLIARRVWLRGRATGRAALVLSFAPIGQALDASLVTGTCLDAELAFYPGAAPLRAQIAARHDLRVDRRPRGTTVAAALDEVAAALTGDPWIESWPVVLAGVVPVPGPGPTWLLGVPPDGAPAETAGGSAREPVPGPDGGTGASSSAAVPEGDDDVHQEPPGGRPPLETAAATDDGSLRVPAGVAGWPLDPAVGTPWRLVAASGGRPVTVAAEWSPRGLVPLSTWDEEGRVVVL
ncbi:SWIM zinc finger family protein [Streptosporangium sp. KLBMP 9127]|nr:SWIM zinc finger family protein [Streptosporangium sp. KLBMP 9127]